MTRVHPLAPVVALDIDGTLADYYGHFKWFAELYLQHDLTLDWSRGPEFSDALGLDKQTYRDVKLAYRQGGMKRSIPVLTNRDKHEKSTTLRSAIELIRGAGAQVWICTTRPWQRLDNIDPDTQFWLRRNVGRVDGVIYGEDKYLDLIDIVGKERILFALDDLPDNVVAAMSLGLDARLRVGPHNEAFRKARPDVKTIDSIIELLAYSTNKTEDWYKNHAL